MTLAPDIGRQPVISAAAAYRWISAAVPLTAYWLSMGQTGRQTGGLDDIGVAGVVVRHGTGSLGHRVNGSFGSSFTSGSPGHHFDPV